MPKNKVSEWSSTPANNTDIGGINIAEGCAPSGINNAIRELMAQVKDMQSGTDADSFVIGGAMTCSGAAVFSSTVAVSGTATFSGNAVLNGDNTIGNASTDAHTLNGIFTAQSGTKILLDSSVTTASAPVLSFNSDTNTGIYRPAADTISVGTNGAERIRIANTGLTVNQVFTCSGDSVLSANVSVGGNLSVTGTTTLTGTTSAPTPAVSDDSTKIATTAFVRDIIPSGVIVMWSGSIATIPSGWLLCNGSNGTPDLRDRFIIGARQDDAGVAETNVTGSLTQTGGSKDAIVVSHTHTATVTDPGHFHNGPTADEFKYYGDSGIVANGPSGLRTTDTIGITQTKATGISVSNSTTGSSGTNANLPPYYALAFIMKS